MHRTAGVERCLPFYFGGKVSGKISRDVFHLTHLNDQRRGVVAAIICQGSFHQAMR